MHPQGTLLLCSCQASTNVAFSIFADKTYLIWSQRTRKLFQVCNCQCTKFPINIFCFACLSFCALTNLTGTIKKWRLSWWNDVHTSRSFIVRSRCVHCSIYYCLELSSNGCSSITSAMLPECILVFKISGSSGLLGRMALFFLFLFPFPFQIVFVFIISFHFQLYLPFFSDCSDDL